jgi:Flp pilus assembly protein TadG
MNMSKRMRDERGVASLEFVLILPMLLFVIFIGVELSRAWMTLNLLTSAAREAARAGVVAAPDAVAAAGNARLTQILAGVGPWFGPGTSCSQNPCAPNAQVTVDVSVNFNTVLPNIWILPQPFVLRQVASMRYE